MSEFEQALWAANNALQQEEASLAASIQGAADAAEEWRARIAEQATVVAQARDAVRIAERAPHAHVINEARREAQPLMERLWRNTGDMDALRSLEAIHNRDEVQQAAIALGNGSTHWAHPFVRPRRALASITGEGLHVSQRPKDYLGAFGVGEDGRLHVVS